MIFSKKKDKNLTIYEKYGLMADDMIKSLIGLKPFLEKSVGDSSALGEMKDSAMSAMEKCLSSLSKSARDLHLLIPPSSKSLEKEMDDQLSVVMKRLDDCIKTCMITYLEIERGLLPLTAQLEELIQKAKYI